MPYRSLLALSILASMGVSANNKDIQGSAETAKLETIVVTASGAVVDVRNAPASISVLTAEDISKTPAADLNEVLRKIPGLSQSVSTDGGSAIQIRGLPQQYTLILVDGKRVGSSSDTYDRYSRNEINWIPTESIERIEVVRGSMSSLYGSDAMGGVINIITKKTNQEWGGSITLGTEVNEDSIRGNDYTGSFVVGGSILDNLKLRLNGAKTYQQADTGLPEGTTSFRFGGGREGSKRDSFGGQLTWDINDDHNLTLDFNQGEWRTLNGPSPTTSNPGATAATTRGPAKMKNENLTLSYAGDHGFATSKASVTYTKYDNKTTAPVIENGQVVLPTQTYEAHAIAKDLIVDASLNIPFTFGLHQNVTVGAQWQKNELDNPNSVGSSANANGVAGLSKNERNAQALFVEDTASITDNLDLTLGLRYDDYDDFGSHLSPRAYLVFRPTDNWTIRGGYSEGFRAPTLRQSNPNFVARSAGAGCRPGENIGGGCNTRGNADLKPETSQSFEIGAGWESGLWKAGLTYFDIDFKDKIDTSTNGVYIGDVLWRDYVNIASATTRGLEANLSVPILEDAKTTWIDSLILTVNATHMLESKNKITNQPLATSPKWSANSSLDLAVNEKLNVNFAAELIGKQYGLEKLSAGSGSTRISTSYVLYNLGANYQINPMFHLNVGIKNLTDKDPNGSSADGNNFYTQGRSYFAAITAKF